MDRRKHSPSMKSVLIVDDDEAFLRVLVRNFERAGYIARTATSISQLRVELKNFRADYAVLDLHLCGESGLDALKLIRDELADCTAVILSGYIDVANAAAAARAGAADCLVKPIGFNELQHALESAAEQNTCSLPLISRPSDVRLHHIVTRWEKNNRNTAKTARDLGMHRRSLQRNLENAGVSRNETEFGGNSSRFRKLRRLYRVWSEGIATS